MLFAALVIERPPLEWSGLVTAVGNWLQDAGLYAFIWLLLVGLAYMTVREFRHRSPWGGLHNVMMALGCLAAASYVVLLLLLSAHDPAPVTTSGPLTEAGLVAQLETKRYTPIQALFFSLAGFASLAACAAPIVRDLGQRRIVPRRIWAIARVAVKEAWSRGIVWVCLIVPIIFLFADWYTTHPRDLLRTRVDIAYFSMTILFVLSAALLGSFSIPADLKSQNMFTIVTKPVERFEIVLGRFVGYAALLFAELAVLSVISYVFVVRGLTEQAVEESFHARVPLLGNELYFYNTGDLPGKADRGENVGREWAYRTHISAKDPQSGRNRVQYAVWEFAEIPDTLLSKPDDEPVRLEFSFDVFRLTVGQEGKGVYCAFTLASGAGSIEELEALFDQGVIAKEYNALFAEARERNKAVAKSAAELEELNAKSKDDIQWTLLERRGAYQIPSVSVTDYHTQTLEIPARAFKIIHKAGEGRVQRRGGEKPPVMRILVNVEDASRHQRVGMAKADLYVLLEDRPFWINFFKGALCIYLITCVVLGLAVVASTYLTGIISLLVTALLCLGGVFLPFIRSLVWGRLETFGPSESLYRLANRQTAALPLDQQSAFYSLINIFDSGFREWLHFIMKLLPDLGSLYPKDYVANGYDITWGTMLLLNHILPVAAYLAPWGILSYYLIKSREIANP